MWNVALKRAQARGSVGLVLRTTVRLLCITLQVLSRRDTRVVCTLSGQDFAALRVVSVLVRRRHVRVMLALRRGLASGISCAQGTILVL